MTLATESTAPTAGFTADGRRYVLRDLHLMARADADVWNDLMNVQIDHRGRCTAGFLQPNNTRYSEGFRTFYVRDEETGRFWSVPFEPCLVEPEAFTFEAGLADIQWRYVVDEIEVTLRLVVPREDTVELWTATARNLGQRERRISLYSYFPIGVIGLLTDYGHHDPEIGLIHEYFPYYVKIEDYYKLRHLKNNVFCAADVTPDAWEIDANAFRGEGDLRDPAQLHLPTLCGGRTDGEPSAAAMQFQRTLAPGAATTVNFIFGPARDRDEMLRLKQRYLGPGGVEQALAQQEAFLAEHAPTVRIDTPDAEFNHYVNHWLPRRALVCGRSLRFNFCPQGRNIIQDAMGATFNDPATARHWYTRIWAHQTANGWTPHGMPMAEGVAIMPITQIPHKDINAWGPVAVHYYLVETGDMSLLDEMAPFADDAAGATIYEHLNRGLEWLLNDRTERKLSRIGQGDWNDPLNMAGMHERGESTWLTEALVYALEVWALVCDRVGDTERAARYRAEAAVSREAINALMWDGEWYARGTRDDGRPFGVQTDEQGKIFINAQSWSLMCGAAAGTRVDEVIAAMNAHLETPVGPMTLAPAFTAMHEDIGKITQKRPGTGENASVYCHAATFYAFALYSVRRPEEAFHVLRRLLVGYGENTLQRAGQLPLYIPNFYRGLPLGAKAGQSSHSPNTGTASWYYRTVVAMLLGVRAEFDGLRLDPQLPQAWPTATVWRQWRGAEFAIEIKKVPGLTGTTVTLDGVALPENLIPVQAPGTTHTVVVSVGA